VATARVPRAEANHYIVIGIDGTPNTPGLIIAPGDWVEFTNNAPFPVQIVFFCANGPVFNNTSRINTNNSSTSQQPQLTEITTDYWVLNLNTNSPIGPFSIEVGINTGTVPAPLSLPITGGYPPTNPDMSTVAVPQQGWVQFHLDQSYNVTWNPSNAFTGPANPVSGSPIYHANTGNQNQTATYTLQSIGGVVGSGTVKIRS
jgi:hypothetical protein